MNPTEQESFEAGSDDLSSRLNRNPDNTIRTCAICLEPINRLEYSKHMTDAHGYTSFSFEGN